MAEARSITQRGSSPFSFMRRFFGDLDRLSGTRGLWAPEVEVSERGDRVVVAIDLPGLGRDDVHVEANDGVLVVSGEREHDHEHEDGGVLRCERSYGAFTRQIALPDGADTDRAEATFHGGVLEITLPLRRPTARGRTIPIRTKKTKP
jgi:HSP20 family protein